MSEAAGQRATKKKMNILVHKEVVKKVMCLYFFFVIPCPYQLAEFDRGGLMEIDLK
jgi:hypothetical protein